MALDVVVCGAGPAGAATALLLARGGARVALVDRARFPREKPCGEAFGPGVSAFFAEHQLASPRGGRAIAGMRLLAGADAATVDYRAAEEAGGRAAWGFTGCRQELDSILVGAAAAAGAVLLEGLAVQGLAGDGRAPRGVWVGRPGAAAERLDAPLVVGAGGLGCPVARWLGGRRTWGRVALVAHVDGMAGLGPHGEAHLDRRGFVGVAPLSGERANVAVVLHPGDLGREGVEALWRDAVRRTGLAERLRRAAVGPIRATGRLGFRPGRLVAAGVLLAGDAAGFVDPFTGDGVSLALTSARLAAAVALDALAGGGPSAERLAPYTRAHRDALAGRLRLDRVLQLMSVWPRLAARAVRSLTDRPDLAERLLAVPADLAPPSSLLRPGLLLAIAGALLVPGRSAEAPPAIG